MGQKIGMSLLIERLVSPAVIIANDYIGGNGGDALTIPILVFALLTSLFYHR